MLYGSYHRIWCPELNNEYNIKGYNKTEFKNQKSSKFASVPACYYCVVRASNATIQFAEHYYTNNRYPIGYDLNLRKKAYYTALASEKLNISKLSDFISGSKKMIKD